MERQPPTIDMMPDGTFRLPPQQRGPGIRFGSNLGMVPLSTKLLVAAVLLTVVAGCVAVAAFAIWVLSMLLPVIVLGGAAAYLLVRFKRWQRRGQGPLAR